MGRARGFFGRILRKPVSHIVAPAIALGAAIELIFTPLATSHDSWTSRLNQGFQNFNVSHNPVDLLNQDVQGNNVFTIAGQQIVQNAIPASITAIGAAVTYKIGKWLGL